MTAGRIPSVEGGIQPTLLTAKGDLISATAASTVAVLPVGTNAQILVADSTASTGLKWATPSGGGKVLQVVHAKTLTYTLMNSTTYADTTLTATITPTLNTSKILVIVNQNGCGKESGNVGTALHLKIVRGATDILLMGDVFGWTNTSLENSGLSVGATFLDSPATTSATTYKTQMKSQVSGQNVKVQNYTATANTNSTITLMEIGV